MCSVIGVHIRVGYSKSFESVSPREGFHKVGGRCHCFSFLPSPYIVRDYIMLRESVSSCEGFQKVKGPGKAKGWCHCFGFEPGAGSAIDYFSHTSGATASDCIESFVSVSSSRGFKGVGIRVGLGVGVLGIVSC